MAALGLFVFGVGAMVGNTLLRGVVLQALWGWFVVSTFSGAPEIDLPEAIGLSLVVNFLTYQYDARDHDYLDRQSIGEQVVESAVAGLVIYGYAYLLGAIIHSFA